MLVTVCKKRWRFRYASLRVNRGECDAPNVTGKEIRVSSALKDCEQLEVILHELMHAADWRASEEHVEEVADDIARALWRIGYRIREVN